MPVPPELNNAATYHRVGEYDLDITVRRAQTFGGSEESIYHPQNPGYNAQATQKRATSTSKHFIAYVEVAMQAKHDPQMRTYCLRNNIQGRNADGTQVPNTNANAPFAFYDAKGLVASEVAAEVMQDRWASAGALSPTGGNNTVFVHGTKNMPGVQRNVQRDNYQYDISFWYMGHEVYVAFHCYPSR